MTDAHIIVYRKEGQEGVAHPITALREGQPRLTFTIGRGGAVDLVRRFFVLCGWISRACTARSPARPLITCLAQRRHRP